MGLEMSPGISHDSRGTGKADPRKNSERMHRLFQHSPLDSPPVNWRRECLVILPALDEALNLPALIRGVRAFLPEVLVMDDASTDGTRAAALAANATVIRNATRQGKGASLRTAWRHAADRGFSWALCMDADGQHSADDIPAFLQAAESSSAAMIVGRRDFSRGTMPTLRAATNAWMSRRLSNLTQTHLPDTQCGFRLVRLSALQSLELRTCHFQIESEMLVACLQAGHRVDWIPVQTLYRGGPSRILPWKDGWRWLRWYVQARQNSKVSLTDHDLGHEASANSRCVPEPGMR